MSRYTLPYLLSLAGLGVPLLQREYDAALALDAERWTRANPDLGLPLALVRKAEAEAHQGSRRVGPPATQRKGCNPWRIVYALRKRLSCSR